MNCRATNTHAPELEVIAELVEALARLLEAQRQHVLDDLRRRGLRMALVDRQQIFEDGTLLLLEAPLGPHRTACDSPHTAGRPRSHSPASTPAQARSAAAAPASLSWRWMRRSLQSLGYETCIDRFTWGAVICHATMTPRLGLSSYGLAEPRSATPTAQCGPFPSESPSQVPQWTSNRRSDITWRNAPCGRNARVFTVLSGTALGWTAETLANVHYSSFVSVILISARLWRRHACLCPTWPWPGLSPRIASSDAFGTLVRHTLACLQFCCLSTHRLPWRAP
jgi:hypothetical protein